MYARGDVLENLRATADESARSQIWIDDHFQRVLKYLVRGFIDAENHLYGLQERTLQKRREGAHWFEDSQRNR